MSLLPGLEWLDVIAAIRREQAMDDDVVTLDRFATESVAALLTLLPTWEGMQPLELADLAAALTSTAGIIKTMARERSALFARMRQMHQGGDG